MNCLYISYDGALEPLGQSQVIPYLRGLSRRGTKFALVTFEKKYCIDKKKIGQLYNELDKAGIKWFNLRYHKSPPVISTIFDIFYGFVVCLRIAVREKIRLVHARSYVSSAIALALKKILKLKFIFDMRGFWADERVEGRLWAKKGNLYHLVKAIEKYFFRNADEIIVLTEQARIIIKDWGYPLKNVSVIPCCADTERFKFDDKSRWRLREKYSLNGKFVFVHTGSLEYWYMMEEMLDYFKAAKDLEPEAHFLVLTHSDRNKILKLVFEKNLNPEDFTILPVSYADMPEHLSMADAGLIFITPVFSKRASSPTKFAEYLGCALPVIINERIGDLTDYVVKNNIGVVLRGFSEAKYRESFERFLNLLKSDENLKFRCRQTACDNFSLTAGIRQYHGIYSKLK
jgi:glycosyltransferase involved in cell wall biosynthesis